MKNNQRPESNESLLVDQTIKALEHCEPNSNSSSDLLNQEQREIAALGNQLRSSVQIDLPETNPRLREMLIDEIDSQMTNPKAKSNESESRSHSTRWLIAALLLVAAGIWGTLQFNSFDRQIEAPLVLKYQQEPAILNSQAESLLETKEEDDFALTESYGGQPALDAPVTSTIQVPDGGTVLIGGVKSKAKTGIAGVPAQKSQPSSVSAINIPGNKNGLPAGGVGGGGGGFGGGGQGGRSANLWHAQSNNSNAQPKLQPFDRFESGPANAPTQPGFYPKSQSANEGWAEKIKRRSKFADTNLNGRLESQLALVERSNLDAANQFDSLDIAPDGKFESEEHARAYQLYKKTIDEIQKKRQRARRRTNNEQYEKIRENQFVAALGEAAVSTFSIDVDTASYANLRRYITGGQLPPPAAVRIEEMVNYFNYDYPQPKGEDPFSVNMELATCPWNAEHKLLRVGLKGKEIHRDERPQTNLVFLLDVSGSMTSADKLPLLKRGFQMMVNKLTENDRVSIVTYAGNAGVALEPTSGDQKMKINEAIEQLTPGGSTHGSAGIELAYKLAQQHFVQEGVNKVILATDGDLNVGITSDDALVKLITEKASEGVFLTVLGFGTGNLKDAKMEKLADNGNGMYAYIDSIREAHKVLVEQMSGSLVTIAKDVKIQIEFNPAEVKAYRLIGYENRMLATEDFDNDAKDAGEIGAGHTVTALYELVTTGATDGFTKATPREFKYQNPNVGPTVQEAPKAALSKAADSGELLTLALRYKEPEANKSKRIEFTLKNDERSFSSASADFRFAASVASFGLLLRGSQFAGDSNTAMIEEIASGAIGDDRSGYRAEFIDLVRRASGQVR